MSMSWMADQIVRAPTPSRAAILCSPAVRELLDVLGRRPGLTAQEVASELGVPMRTARNRIASARRHGLIVGDSAQGPTPSRWRVV